MGMELREIAAPDFGAGADREEWMARTRLLASRGLSVPAAAAQTGMRATGASQSAAEKPYILGLFADDDKLIGTGSLIDGIIQGVAVDAAAEGEGAAARIVTALIKEASARGQRRVFLYTKPEEAPRFEGLGFGLLAETDGKDAAHAETASAPDGKAEGAALLEWGPDSIEVYKKSLEQLSAGRPEDAGILVMNCDPFTLGHRWLIGEAARRSPWVYVLVVEEEASVFPFSARLAMVRGGCAGLANVSIIPGGPYAISRATFPDYFFKVDALTAASSPDRASLGAGRMPEAIAAVHAALDLELFKKHLAPALRARTRYVGEEPFSPTTAMYNSLMRAILSRSGGSQTNAMHPEYRNAGIGAAGPEWALKVCELPRLCIEGEPVSASRVRSLIAQGNIDAARRYLPDSTWRWLLSPEGQELAERLRRSS